MSREGQWCFEGFADLERFIQLTIKHDPSVCAFLALYLY